MRRGQRPAVVDNVFAMTIAFCAAFSPAARWAKEWTESKKTPVPVEEWVQYIKSDSEFRLVQPQDPKDKPRDTIWIDPKDKARVSFFITRMARFRLKTLTSALLPR
jgi:hypothetical protein